MTIKNSYLTGLLAGFIFPAFFFGILYGLNVMISSVIHSVPVLTVQKMLFISAALNVLPFRYIFVKKNLNKTGGGMLLLTVILVIMIMLIF
jgi:hypothetical protein